MNMASSILELVECFGDATADNERAATIRFLVLGNADVERVSKMPKALAILWAIIHPARFAVAVAVCAAATAIHRGEHLRFQA
jgi:hypothetical protein